MQMGPELGRRGHDNAFRNNIKAAGPDDAGRASLPPTAAILAGRIRAIRAADPRHEADPAARHGTLLPRLGYSAKVLEYMPDDKRLLIRAGVGWQAGTIDHVSLGADVESPAGYAFHTGKIVISNHLQEETRFRTPQFLADHGIRRAVNVLIARGGEGHLPFGVLEADSADPGQFDPADADFLAGFADCSAPPSSASKPMQNFNPPSTTRPC
jgi:GAF domain-containing protein